MLGVAADKRMTTFPDIPTMSEQGVNLVIGSFHGLFIPNGAPDSIVGTLGAALKKAMGEKAVNERMANVGLGPTYMDRTEAARFVSGQDATYRKLIEKLGMTHASKKK